MTMRARHTLKPMRSQILHGMRRREVFMNNIAQKDWNLEI